MGMSIFVDTIAEEVESQPKYLRFKASILLGLTSIVWILNSVLPAFVSVPEQMGAMIASVVSAVALLINRLTKDGVTPSMGKRLEETAGKIEAASAPVPLPVYGGVSTGGTNAD